MSNLSNEIENMSMVLIVGRGGAAIEDVTLAMRDGSNCAKHTVKKTPGNPEASRAFSSGKLIPVPISREISEIEVS